MSNKTILDKVTLEIIRGKLLATADEMGIVLARSSMSPVIYEVLDFACGICDAEAQLIAQTNGITLFTGTFSLQLQSVIRKYSNEIQPGDVFITNNPYQGGTHTCDICLIKPIFIDGTIVAYAMSVAHWTEVGGATPGSIPPNATEIFQEGLRLPGIRICRNNKLETDIVDLIRSNVRLPVMVLGDLNAGIASVRIAQARLEEIFCKYGQPTVLNSFVHIIRSSEKLSRKAVSSLPNGVYKANDWIDGDGNSNQQIPVCVEIRIDDDEITFDFTGTAKQRSGPINCALGALHSAVKTVFKALVDPQGSSNEGWFKPINIICPPETVFTAETPAPTGWYYEGSAQASELVWKALAEIAPERFSAGSYMSLCAMYIFGSIPNSNEMFVHIEPAVGGWGATSERDGESALIATTDGDTYNYSVELFEAKYPIRIRQYTLNTSDGSGVGHYRGGFGVIREYEILEDETATYASLGRTIEKPWGLHNGGEGSCNYMEISSNGLTNRYSRISHYALTKGDVIKIATGGGGGFGDPYSRPIDDVLRDVTEEYITPELARSAYGVAISRDGYLDKNMTEMLREPNRIEHGKTRD